MLGFIGAVQRWVQRRPGLFEARTLAGLLILAACLWGFAELADEVAEGSTQDMDRTVLLALREPDDVSKPIGPDGLQRSVRDITALGSASVLTLMTLFAAGWLGIQRRWRLVGLLLAAVVGATILSTGLKKVFDRERPEMALRLMPTSDMSFPSGHSTLAAALFLTVGLLLSEASKSRREKVYFLSWAVALTVLVGLSRIYLGAHYPTDVLAGWCVGTAWALVCSLVARWLVTRADGTDLPG